jgi:hypothetical protein
MTFEKIIFDFFLGTDYSKWLTIIFAIIGLFLFISFLFDRFGGKGK